MQARASVARLEGLSGFPCRKFKEPPIMKHLTCAFALMFLGACSSGADSPATGTGGGRAGGATSSGGSAGGTGGESSSVGGTGGT